MNKDELSKEAIKSWLEYGQAINDVFGLKGDILPFQNNFDSDDSQQLLSFISYVQNETKSLRESE